MSDHLWAILSSYSEAKLVCRLCSRYLDAVTVGVVTRQLAAPLSRSALRVKGDGETLTMVEFDSISSPNTHMLLPSGILLPRKLEASLRGWKIIPAPKWSTLQPALVMVSKVLN